MRRGGPPTEEGVSKGMRHACNTLIINELVEASGVEPASGRDTTAEKAVREARRLDFARYRIDGRVEKIKTTGGGPALPAPAIYWAA